MKNLQQFKKQDGGFVITAILAIALIAVIVIFALKAYQYGMEKTRVSRTVDLVQKIQSAVNDAYANSNDFTGLNTGNVINMVGSENISTVGSGASAVIITPWYAAGQAGSANTVTVNVASSSTNAYDVTLNSLPTDACVAVGSNFVGVHNVAIGGKSGTPTPTATPADVAGFCKSGGTLTIQFTAN